MGWISDVWSWLTTDDVGTNAFGGVIAAAIVGVVLATSKRARQLAARVGNVLRDLFRVVADIRPMRRSRVEAARELARNEGRAEANAAHAAAEEERRKKPPPPVRWAARQVRGRYQWDLLKSGSGTAFDVRLDCDDPLFNLIGDAAWELLPAGAHAVQFQGAVTDSIGFSMGVTVVISWEDEHRQPRRDTLSISAPWA